jgi:hypothetical protein
VNVVLWLGERFFNFDFKISLCRQPTQKKDPNDVAIETYCPTSFEIANFLQLPNVRSDGRRNIQNIQ